MTTIAMGRYVRGGNCHAATRVIVCFDLYVCQCMVFRIYRAMALSLATPGVTNRGSAQARPKQALHDTSMLNSTQCRETELEHDHSLHREC